MKVIFRIIIFILTFLFGVILFSELIKEKETEPAVEMADATLPVICMDFGGNKADRLYGYTEEMEASLMREALIPLTNEKALTLSYQANGRTVRTVSYEITTPDTGEVVANATIGNFLEDGDYMTASFDLSASILMDREYPICFTMETSEGNVYYYARLLMRSTDQAADYVSFVCDFCEKCLSKSTTSGISTYLETSENASGNDVTDVSLKSTFNQVTWSNLSPTILRGALPTITEINNTTCSLTNSYLLSALNEDGKTEIYEVSEFYRLRYGTDRMYVLDFTRQASQVFDPENLSAISTSGISLGVTDPDVTLKTDETGSILAFIQNGTLWYYNDNSRKLVRVFGFRGSADETDARLDHRDYDIDIIRVSNAGDIDFVVCGYMDRGRYEGRNGILVCSYSVQTGRVEEKAFIASSSSCELLAEDLSHLTYVSENNIAWFYLDESVIRVDLAKQSVSTLLENIDPECFRSSTDNSVIAWMDQMSQDNSTSVTLMNLETEETSAVNASSGMYIRALGFINNDFIYGEAPTDELLGGTDGKTLFPIQKLTVQAENGDIALTYEKEGIRIIGVTITGPLIELKRAEIGANRSLTEIQSDTIMNNSESSEDLITVRSVTDDRRGKVVLLSLSDTIRNLNPMIQTARFEASRPTALENVTAGYAGPSCTVYAGGHLMVRTNDASEAVTLADENLGIALDDQGRYLFERGNTDTENEIQNGDIPEAMLLESMDADTISAALKDGETLVDLKGCTLEEVLYQVSCGRPVLARTSDGGTALIVGYNKYNTKLYNFETGEHYWYGINDSTAEFAAGGNVFLTVYSPEATKKES